MFYYVGYMVVSFITYESGDLEFVAGPFNENDPLEDLKKKIVTLISLEDLIPGKSLLDNSKLGYLTSDHDDNYRSIVFLGVPNSNTSVGDAYDLLWQHIGS